jgi:Fe-S-cluster containining protein
MLEKEISASMDNARPTPMTCRPGCGACCIAPSLSSTLPGMPEGKPAGVRCAQLSTDNQCLLFGMPERPAVCVSFPVMADHCGSDRNEALARLAELERMTAHVRKGGDRT